MQARGLFDQSFRELQGMGIRGPEVNGSDELLCNEDLGNQGIVFGSSAEWPGTAALHSFRPVFILTHPRSQDPRVLCPESQWKGIDQ